MTRIEMTNQDDSEHRSLNCRRWRRAQPQPRFRDSYGRVWFRPDYFES